MKLLEEGRPATSFWLTHPSTHPLPPALRGRAASTLTVTAADPAALARTLVAATGISEEEAHTWLRGCSYDLPLAVAATRFDMRAQVELYQSGPQHPTPTIHTHELLTALAHLAVARHHMGAKAPVPPAQRKGTLRTADLTRLSPQARATTRKLVEKVIERWREDLTRELVHATPPRARQLHAVLADLAAAERGVAFNTPLPTVLAAALHATNPVPVAAA